MGAPILKKGDDVKVTVYGRVVNPCTSQGYITLETNAGHWNVSPRFATDVVKRARPEWWPPQENDVVVLDNGHPGHPIHLTLVRRKDKWEVVCGPARITWSDADVLDNDPRLVVRGRKAQV